MTRRWNICYSVQRVSIRNNMVNISGHETWSLDGFIFLAQVTSVRKTCPHIFHLYLSLFIAVVLWWFVAIGVEAKLRKGGHIHTCCNCCYHFLKFYKYIIGVHSHYDSAPNRSKAVFTCMTCYFFMRAVIKMKLQMWGVHNVTSFDMGCDIHSIWLTVGEKYEWSYSHSWLFVNLSGMTGSPNLKT